MNDLGELDRPANQDTPDSPGTPAAETGAGAAARRGAADPVKTLMHHHRELCERAVDPLEIAAGLEAHGVTDRTAARFRHRDVFALAEEMYARVPRDEDSPPPAAEPSAAPRPRLGRLLPPLLPGALAAATVTAAHLTHGRTRPLVVAAGLLAVAAGTRAALRRGPLSTPPSARTWHAAARMRAATCWLLGYALLGDGLLAAVLSGGPDGPPGAAPDSPWPLTVAPALALTLACAPAAWTAHLFAARARRRLAASRGLKEFTAAARPLLLGAAALYLTALTALTTLTAAALREPPAYPQVLTLGTLLLLARLLTVHRLPHAPAHALTAAAVTEATALALVLGARLPGYAFLAAPVDTLTGAWGPGGVPALACGTAALVLLCHAARTLTRAVAHAPTGDHR